MISYYGQPLFVSFSGRRIVMNECQHVSYCIYTDANIHAFCD